jgi:hypothetical protein
MTTTPSQDAATNAAKITADIMTVTDALAAAAAMVTEPTAITAIEGFFTALPTLLSFMVEFNKFITLVSGGNPQAYVANLGTVMAQWNSAVTEKEKQDAAQNLANSIRNLPLK